MITKTPTYRAFVLQKIEKGEIASSEIGNVYTASIFISLISTLEATAQKKLDLTGHVMGFFAYCSGSKAKVFAGKVQPEYVDVVKDIKQNARLNNRKQISFAEYEYRGKLVIPLDSHERQVSSE